MSINNRYTNKILNPRNKCHKHFQLGITSPKNSSMHKHNCWYLDRNRIRVNQKWQKYSQTMLSLTKKTYGTVVVNQKTVKNVK